VVLVTFPPVIAAFSFPHGDSVYGGLSVEDSLESFLRTDGHPGSSFALSGPLSPFILVWVSFDAAGGLAVVC